MPLVEEILREAEKNGASDVHLTVGTSPKMRVNGRLLNMQYSKMTAADTLDILLTIMTEAQRERFEERGECDFAFSVPDGGRFRVNAYRQKGNVALAFRVVGERVPSFQELGIPSSLEGLYQRRRGLVLAVGPSGCGKTTTLAAIVDKINENREAHILTLEDSIEYLHPHRQSIVNQREIGIDSESYADALQAAFREDPDVILVGELRDSETAALAVTAAETGHLVLSTLNAVGAADALKRIIHLFQTDRQQQIRMQLAGALETVVFQQLIPTADGERRVAAFEVLIANREVRKLIREGKEQQLSGIMQANRKTGMITMNEVIVQLYQAGKIDKDTALLYAQEPLN